MRIKSVFKNFPSNHKYSLQPSFLSSPQTIKKYVSE